MGREEICFIRYYSYYFVIVVCEGVFFELNFGL